MNTFNQRRLQSDLTRKNVLEAARREFERVGFERANVRTIATRAKVSAGTVLHHGKDKRELFHAALFDGLDAVLAVELARVSTASLPGRLERLSKQVFAHYAARPKLARSLLKESLFAEPPWSQAFARQTAGVHATVVRWFDEAVSRGELEQGDAALFALAWLSFFYFALLGWVQGAQSDPVRIVRRLTAQHLEGLSR